MLRELRAARKLPRRNSSHGAIAPFGYNPILELLQRMPVFGGIRTEVLQFLLGFCPIVSVPANDFFFRERDKGDSMFVLEMGKAAVLKSWRGQDYLLRTLNEGDCFGEMAVMATVHVARPSVRSKIVSQSIFQPPTLWCPRMTVSSSRQCR